MGVRVGHIRFDKGGGPACIGDLADSCFAAVAIHVGDDNECPRMRQPKADGTSDTARSPGDNRRLV